MTKFSRLFIFAIFAVIATGATAEETDCKGCDPQTLTSSHRDQIKADRAKYDRENERVTARPWDVIKDDKPLPDKNR
jgi:hypothetical protein